MLRIELLPPDTTFEAGSVPTLRARYVNDGDAPLALTFWWNRALRVRSTDGVVVEPGPGPELPCGAAEEWHVLAPGAHTERHEPLVCTQPAGQPMTIGWQYRLPAGTWRVTLRFEAPPAHGFTQASPHPNAWVGSVESNEVTLVVTEPAGLVAQIARFFTG